MGTGDQRPRLFGTLGIRHSRNIRERGLLQVADKPLSSRELVDCVAILEIATVPQIRVIRRGNRQILTRIDRPIVSLLVMEPESIVVGRGGYQESALAR